MTKPKVYEVSANAVGPQSTIRNYVQEAKGQRVIVRQFDEALRMAGPVSVRCPGNRGRFRNRTSTASCGVLSKPLNNAGFASRPRAAMTPLTPVSRRISAASWAVQISPFPMVGMPWACASEAAKAIPGRDGATVEGSRRVRP